MGTYSKLNYHIVFSTKGRQPIISNSIEDELYRYINGVITREGAQLIKIGGIENHIHIAIKLNPQHHIPDLVKQIKGNSSKWINENCKINGRFSWQVGYGIFSVSESQLIQVVSYIEKQKSHHKKNNFQEEYVKLLEKHGIEFNLGYL